MNHALTSSHRYVGFPSRIAVSGLVAFCLILGALPGWAEAPAAPAKQPPAVTASWDILDGLATVGLDTSTLGSLGFQVTDLSPTVSGWSPHPLSVVARNAPSFALDNRIGLRAIVAWDGFRGFEGTSMQTRGGFRLVGGAGTFDLTSLVLRPGAKPGVLDLFDAAGMAVLTMAEAQWELDAPTGRLRLFNADLRILPDLARLLGDDRYAGVAVGVLDLDATLAAGTLPPVPPLPPGAAPPPCGDWSGTVDVTLDNMASVSQNGISTVNGRSVVVVTPSANLKNVGTANVPWYTKFTNLGVPPWNDQHPLLVWQMTRSTPSGDFFEPLGRSDVKHAFTTVNSGCDPGACTDSHILGLGCSDLYGSGTNNSNNAQAPRSEVSALTATWAHCGGIGTHFDANGDCSQDFFGAGENAFSHGLKAAESDLMVAGASYYVEAFYIIRNDVNIFNSMGYRRVAPAKPAATWTFPTVGAYSTGPPVNAWVNPTTPGPDADNRVLDTGEGRVQLVVKVTDVTGSPGRKRFAYAMQNHDFDRQIKSLHIPFDPTGASITNIVYADGDGFATNDWTATTDPTGITWTAPTGTTPPAPVDYASLVAFRFDIDRTTVPVSATLGAFEAGTPTLSIQSLAPAAPNAPPQGSFFTVTPCRLVDTRGGNGPALIPGQERTFNSSGICGIPAGAKALAINVTAIDAAAGGHVVVYSGAFPSTATINYTTGVNRANNAIVALELDGSFKVMAVQPTGTLQLAVDVSGYFQ